MTKADKVVPIDSGDPGLESLLSYRLSVVANLLSRSQFTRFSSVTDITQHEWRVLVLVDTYGPLPVKALAKHAGLDFGQASRLVTRVHEAGYVAKNATPDGRSVSLSLTPRGRALHRKLWALAMACNDEYLASLTKAQREMLLQALDTLAKVAKPSVERQDVRRTAVARRA